MMFLNGKRNTYFAGSWTLVVSYPARPSSESPYPYFSQNMHELACVSGIAAAFRLGADYVKFDDFAETFFSSFLLLVSTPLLLPANIVYCRKLTPCSSLMDYDIRPN